MTDPAGVSWTYDARGRVTEANDPDKGVTRTTYDNADRPVTSTDARGVALTTGNPGSRRNRRRRCGPHARQGSVPWGVRTERTQVDDSQCHEPRNGFHKMRRGLGEAVRLGKAAERYDKINTSIGVAATVTYEARYFRANCGLMPEGC